jgi:hypothetical protein
MTTIVCRSSLLGFTVTLAAAGCYVGDIHGIDSGCFPTATQAILFCLQNCKP